MNIQVKLHEAAETTIDHFNEENCNRHTACQEYNLWFFNKTFISIKNRINDIFARYGDVCKKYETKSEYGDKILDFKTEKFIDESKKKFGDKFDYSLTKYNRSHKKLVVICKLHGKSEQIPAQHLKSIHGCMTCSKNFSKININDMLEKARRIHNNKYDYSKVAYERRLDNVIIVCPLHGEFLKTIYDHVQLMSGCPSCTKDKKNGIVRKIVTNASFIEEANLKHNYKYDYSETKYIDAQTKVKIKCLKHGFFWQIPRYHASKGNGCPKCWKGFPLTKESFIEKSMAIHGDFYDYSKVNYINARTYVTIICPKHGNFEQVPDSHLNKSTKCPKCAAESMSTYFSDTLENFIAKSKKIHGNIFIYDECAYINNHSKVTLICANHGKFFVAPHNHISKKMGCPKCNMCPSCQLWRTMGQLCSYCEPKNNNTKYQKTKEWKIVNFLKKELPDRNFIHNKSVGTICTQNRIFPDILFDLETHHVIVEIDEHQHRGANYNCEEKRMRDIIANIGTSCYFIRYNPDNKLSNETILLESIKKSFEYENIKDDFDQHGFYAEYLFYK